MEEQKYIERHCKMCNQNRLFVTSLSPTGFLICCTCGYRQSIIPFKLISDQFGHKIISGDKLV